MMRLSIKTTVSTLCVLQAATLWAASSGNLFQVTTAGTSLGKAVNFTICLNVNGEHPLSCQNYTTTNAVLLIKTTTPNHVYNYAGVKVNTPGFRYTSQVAFAPPAQPDRETPTGYTFIGLISDNQASTGAVVKR